MATLKSLVDETTNIKNELIACNEALKNNLTNKGVIVSSSDKLSALVDKVADINIYSLMITAYTQTTQPTSPKVGDLWINTTKKVNLILSVSKPSNPSENDLWIELLNPVCDVAIDSSINTTLNITNDKTYTIDLTKDTFGSNTGLYSLFKNSLSIIYGNYGETQLYSEGNWNDIEVNFWTGSEWKSTSPSKLYIIQGGSFASEEIIGQYNSNISSKVTEGSTHLSLLLKNNSGFGRLSFTFGKRVNLSKYNTVSVTFSHNINSVSGSINLIQSESQVAQTEAPGSSVKSISVWSGTTSSSYKTVTAPISSLDEPKYFGLYLSTYDPAYIYIKEMYLSKDVALYSEDFDGTNVVLTEEEIKQGELMIKEARDLKEIYLKSLGFNEEDIKIINDEQLDINEYFKLNGNKVLQTLEIAKK